MIAEMKWLAVEAARVHQMFHSFFFGMVTLLLLIGIVCEFLKMPIGLPSFPQLIGRTVIAALLLSAYPEITNSIANIADAISAQLGNMNDFQLVLDRMSQKLGELSWSWVSIKESVMLAISFLTFFILYFSVHVANAIYLYAWTLLYVFSPILIALYVLPVTAAATGAMFRSLIEIASWKIVWSVIATLLWSAALSRINEPEMQVSFLTAICFNIILAGSLLLTPFVVHALAGSGIVSMTKNVGALAIGGLAITPGGALKAGKSFGESAKHRLRPNLDSKKGGTKQFIKSEQAKRRGAGAKHTKRAPQNQSEF